MRTAAASLMTSVLSISPAGCHCCMPLHIADVRRRIGLFIRLMLGLCSISQVRLVFIARTDIRAGQELTFDYRFKVEEGVEKVPCRCGAPNCRGSLN